MEAFNELTADEAKLTAENVRAIENEFLASSQILLKAEWRRVKSGERAFRVAKWLALTVVLVFAAAGIFVAYRALRP